MLLLCTAVLCMQGGWKEGRQFLLYVLGSEGSC